MERKKIKLCENGRDAQNIDMLKCFRGLISSFWFEFHPHRQTPVSEMEGVEFLFGPPLVKVICYSISAKWGQFQQFQLPVLLIFFDIMSNMTVLKCVCKF